MSGSYIIVIISLWVHPLIGLIISKRTRNKIRLKRIVSSCSLILLLILALAKLNKISFASEELDAVFFSICYLAICYLIWNLIFIPNRFFKKLGITISIIVFGFGVIFGVGSLIYPDNGELDVVCSKNIEEYKGTIYHSVGFEGKWDVYSIQLFKHKGPFKKLIIEKNYINEIPKKHDRIDFDFNKENNELDLLVYDIVKSENIIIWQDLISIR